MTNTHGREANHGEDESVEEQQLEEEARKRFAVYLWDSASGRFRLVEGAKGAGRSRFVRFLWNPREASPEEIAKGLRELAGRLGKGSE